MGSRPAAAVATAAALAVTVAGAVPTSAVGDRKPRAGRYVGKEAFGSTPLPVSFTVSRDHARVTKFTGQAQARNGCSNYITSFQAPTGPMSIGADGRFSASSNNYPGDVRVRVVGVFTSRTKARGHISVRIAKQKDCDARRLFRAHIKTRAAGNGVQSRPT